MIPYDIVMEHNKNVPRRKYANGRAVAVHPGDDGLVRAVDVKFENGRLPSRDSKLCHLEPYSSISSSEIIVQPASGEDVPTKNP